MNSKKYMEKTEQYVLHTYNRFPVVLEKGDGVYLTDADGKSYLDFGAGIAVFALGYGNKAYNDALKKQIDQLIHTSNLYYNIPLEEAAEKLGEVPHHIEGERTSGWVLLDYSTVIIHLFLPEQREFYDLERMWLDADQVDITPFLEEAKNEA